MRNSVSTQKMAFDFNNICRLCMAKGHPMIPIFEGVLSIRIMSLVPLIKVGYYCNLLKQSFLSVCEISTGY